MHLIIEVIRKITKEDNPLVAKLIRDVFDEHRVNPAGTVYVDPTTDALFELHQVKDAFLYVVELNGKIVGSCGIFPTEGLPSGCAEIVKFYFLKEARGKGLGKKIFKICLNEAKKLGYTEIYLESLPEFATAIDMYKKLGFSQLSSPLGNSGHYGCNIWMKKEIL